MQSDKRLENKALLQAALLLIKLASPAPDNANANSKLRRIVNARTISEGVVSRFYRDLSRGIRADTGTCMKLLGGGREARASPAPRLVHFVCLFTLCGG